MPRLLLLPTLPLPEVVSTSLGDAEGFELDGARGLLGDLLGGRLGGSLLSALSPTLEACGALPAGADVLVPPAPDPVAAAGGTAA
jgi:hypothetical protein